MKNLFQASIALELFNLISADLNSYQPIRPSYPFPGSSSELEDSHLSDKLAFPKSLYLLEPLFSSYEMNPVASGAQSSVPVPEDLDLDAWFVPPPQESSSITFVEDAEVAGGKSKKGKKGKGKDVGSSANGRKMKHKRNEDLLTPTESDHETLEEKARVRSCFLCNNWTVYLFIYFFSGRLRG